MKDIITSAPKSLKIKYIILSVLAVLFFFLLAYIDLRMTYSRAILLLDSIFSGNFPDGYSFEGAFYVFVHIFLAVWCLPIYPFIRLGILPVDSAFAYLWAKLLIVVLAFLVIYYMVKILNLADIRLDADWIFLLCSSSLCFLPCLATGQYDGIEIIFAVLSVYFIVKDEKLSTKALLLLSLSVCTKFLFVFSAIVIVLLFEKKPLYIIHKLIIVMTFSIVFFAFSKYALYVSPDSGAVELGGEFLKRLFSFSITGSNYSTSIYFIVYFAVCILAYLNPIPQTKSEIVEVTSWYCIACGAAFIIFANTNPNWPSISYIFIIMIFAINTRFTKINLLLDFIYTTCLLIEHICFDYGTYYISETAFDMLILKNVNHHAILWENCESGFAILRVFGIETLLPAIAALGAVALAAIVIINYPYRKGSKLQHISSDYGLSVNAAENIRLAILILYFIAQTVIAFVI